MLKVTSIKNGIVIDHIKAGMGIKIFKYLSLQEEEVPTALIMNVTSRKLGKKDIIKVESDIEIDYEILGLFSPTITINKVKNEEIIDKIQPELPEKVENVLVCRNPRCITTVERNIPQVFKLTNKEKGTYRCDYCDEELGFKEF